MSFNVLNRKIHYWISFGAALPLLVMICSGLLLQAKKQSTWIQPADIRGTGTSPAISIEAVLTALKTVPEMNVRSWDDVNRLDMRIGKGVVKVWLSGCSCRPASPYCCYGSAACGCGGCRLPPSADAVAPG